MKTIAIEQNNFCVDTCVAINFVRSFLMCLDTNKWKIKPKNNKMPEIESLSYLKDIEQFICHNNNEILFEILCNKDYYEEAKQQYINYQKKELKHKYAALKKAVLQKTEMIIKKDNSHIRDNLKRIKPELFYKLQDTYDNYHALSQRQSLNRNKEASMEYKKTQEDLDNTLKQLTYYCLEALSIIPSRVFPTMDKTSYSTGTGNTFAKIANHIRKKYNELYMLFNTVCSIQLYIDIINENHNFYLTPKTLLECERKILIYDCLPYFFKAIDYKNHSKNNDKFQYDTTNLQLTSLYTGNYEGAPLPITSSFFEEIKKLSPKAFSSFIAEKGTSIYNIPEKKLYSQYIKEKMEHHIMKEDINAEGFFGDASILADSAILGYPLITNNILDFTKPRKLYVRIVNKHVTSHLNIPFVDPIQYTKITGPDYTPTTDDNNDDDFDL